MAAVPAQLRDHLQRTLAPAGVFVLAVERLQWLSACFSATDTGRKIRVGSGGASKTDLLFILQAGYDKLQQGRLNEVELRCGCSQPSCFMQSAKSAWHSPCTRKHMCLRVVLPLQPCPAVHHRAV